METASNGQGWFKAHRTEDAMELIKLSQPAFCLAWVISARARWRRGFNAHGLSLGEAMIGDYRNYGISEQQYRTAKAVLEKHGFATFRATNKGTIAKLSDARLFEVLESMANEQTNGRPTNGQRTANGQPTTNIEGYKGKKGRGVVVGHDAGASRPDDSQLLEAEDEANLSAFQKQLLERIKRSVIDWRRNHAEILHILTDDNDSLEVGFAAETLEEALDAYDATLANGGTITNPWEWLKKTYQNKRG